MVIMVISLGNNYSVSLCNMKSDVSIPVGAVVYRVLIWERDNTLPDLPRFTWRVSSMKQKTLTLPEHLVLFSLYFFRSLCVNLFFCSYFALILSTLSFDYDLVEMLVFSLLFCRYIWVYFLHFT